MDPIPIVLSARPQQNEWPNEEWAAALSADGKWQPAPFQEFVLKVHGRCNLSCDYCYVYELADQSWRSRPGAMSVEILKQTALRIGEHAATHALSDVFVVFHGGEPLLAGPEFIDHASKTLRDAMPDGTALQLSIQTNGALLNEDFLRVFDRHDIHVGVSLDGDRLANDKHRRYANGRGSYDEVVRGLRLLTTPAYRRLFSGLLCTIDVDNDPVGTYEAMLEFEPPSVDFILPHANWIQPPPRWRENPDHTPYGDWLIAVFERWYSAPTQETDVRTLRAILDELLGGRSHDEVIGLAAIRLIEVETNATVEQVCSLKSAFDGATGTGFNVFAQSFDDALGHPGVMARQAGAEALSDICGGCLVRDVCGGGHYVHRYRTGSGFRNPSVYCADLYRLITYMGQRVAEDLQNAVKVVR
ncbi:FxsB family cyclophane-forming radical SAM/SPASM peptide maturase [Streptomyces sp. NPDC001820]|uniref:FxsB family cyclophane-forming radical SAM/SPASM peptide maturase n=1 Tax=Streptomyces sp. NPDC001820 TaxID=3364613 RepID=UPI0036B44BFE